MKLLLVLLACIAATNAAYCSYSYSYYYSHSFRVYPATNYYRYTVYFKNDWCSYNYYAPILKVYPGSDCSDDGWTETAVGELKTEMENMLAEALIKIVAEIISQRDAWFVQLDACHQEYKDYYYRYMYQYYDYLKSCVTTQAEKDALDLERDEKIAEYNSKLDDLRADCWNDYNDAITKRVSTIQEYHVALCDNAEKCLLTRLEKIDEFETKLLARVLEYLDCYWDYLVSVVKCRGAQYKQTLQCVHGTSWMAGKIDELIAEFESQQCNDYKLYEYLDYYSRMYEYKDRLIKLYRCSYTCTLSNSCLRFYKRTYYRSCQSLGQWYSYSKVTFKTRGGLGPFKYTWRKTTYKGLTKCDLDVLHKPADDVKTEFEDLLQARVVFIAEKFVVWKNTWIDYHVEYCDRYDEIIKQRHEWVVENLRAQYVCYNNSNVLTPEQEAKIAELIEELRVKRETAVAEYKEQLLNAIVKCVAEFNESIEVYRANVNKLIESIIGKYTTCLETRTTKIAEYKTCLEETRNKQRAALIEHMYDAKNCHYDVYRDILEFYSGDPLPDCAAYMAYEYGYFLTYYCDGLVYEFDTYWAGLLNQLVHHYSCNYRCIISSFSMPSYCWGSYYSWRVSYPTANCYTYYYQRYTTYCSYRLRCYGGTWSYCTY